MNADRIVVLELTRMEAAHLAGLVTQFAELLEDRRERRRRPCDRATGARRLRRRRRGGRRTSAR